MPDKVTWWNHDWWSSAEIGSVHHIRDVNDVGEKISTYSRDASGRVSSVSIADAQSRTVSFVNNAGGQVMRRYENPAAGNDPNEVHYYLSGIKIGAIGNNGTDNVDYSTGVSMRNQSGSGLFRGGATFGAQFADFDQSYDAINGMSTASAAHTQPVWTSSALPAYTGQQASADTAPGSISAAWTAISRLA